MDKPEYSLREPEVTSEKLPEAKPEKVGVSAVKPDSSERPHNSGIPYSVDHFDIKGWSEMLLTPALDYNKTIGKVAAIEEFIKSQAVYNGLKDEAESYAYILKDLEDELGLTSSHESSLRIEKVFNLINIIKKDLAHKERKKSIFNLLNNQK